MLEDFVADNIEHERDVDEIICAICYDPENVDEASARALETTLLSVQSDEACTSANDVRFFCY